MNRLLIAFALVLCGCGANAADYELAPMPMTVELAPVPMSAEAIEAANSAGYASAAEAGYKPAPTLGENSAYTVKEVEQSGTNTVITYEINEQTHELTPHYYEIELKTDFGEIGNANPQAVYYKWQQDENGTYSLVAGSADDYDLIYHKDGSLNYDRINSDLAGADITHGYTGSSITSSSGGAIFNDEGWSIGNITGDFISNFVVSSEKNHNAYGGAIYNEGTIENISGDFIGNSANNGGAIYNIGSIEDITGDFIGNKTNYGLGNGGAIYNEGTIGNITGDFIGNSADNFAGAIYNEGTIENITGDFIDNSAHGVIYNEGTIGNITGDFIGNSDNYGGAIYNEGTIENITGNFIGNSDKTSQGGAINNIKSIIRNITGDFISNTADSDGGAIDSNQGSIESITGNFIGNSAGNDGGAIRGFGNRFGDINGNFINNTAKGNGGAIYNYNYKNNSIFEDIKGDFISNSAEKSGGAIYNTGTMTNLTGNFVDNSAGSSGGAIYNTNGIGNLKGDFINNSSVNGGAIYNSGIISSISGNIIENSAERDGGAIANILSDSMIESINANFSNNIAKGNGGAIYNEGIIASPNATPNYQIYVTAYATTLVNKDSGESVTFYEPLDDELFTDINKYGYKIVETNIDEYIEELSNEEFNMMLQYIKEHGEEFGLSTENPLDKLPEDAFLKYTGGIVNSSFYNNSAVSENDTAHGGAIYTDNFLRLEANNGYTSVISGNSVTDKNGTRDEAIYVANPNSTLTLNANTNGKFVIDDKINGVEGYTVKFDGDNSGYVQLNNNIQGNANIELNNISLHLAKDDSVLNGNNFLPFSGSLNMINGSAGIADLNNLTLNGDLHFLADVDLLNKEMDRFSAQSYGQHNGNLILDGVNLISDSQNDRTEILFAEQGLKDNVISNVASTDPNNFQLTAYSPIYKYNVAYDNRDDAGYMLFTRGGGASGNPSDSFNPAVLNTPVANLAAGQATMNETFKYIFQHADTFTQLPAFERMAKIKQNYYALSTDFNNNLGTLSPEFSNKGVWVRPYTSFETMNIKNGPDVDAITYGTLIGFDSDFEHFKNGWYGVTTGYVGYNGSQLNYANNDTSLNGGLLGVTQTLYKGNFWTALTASAGAAVGENSNMYGSDEFVSLLAGIASKTGYNFEFKDGKFIIQPIMFLSYTFVNTFDYTNSAGVSIESDPLHTIQLNPSVRFIANLKNGWQPYASVGMVWNLLNQTETTANGIVLPQMHIRPYVEYGVGVQKLWADKFTGFLQAMIRNGGRNGIALTGGFRWNLGSAPDNSNNKPKTVIKSLNPKIANE